MKMPTHIAGLGEKGIAWSKQTTSDHKSIQLGMHVVNFLTENYSTKLKLRSQASHTKRNAPLMFILTWFIKSLYYLVFFLKVSSLKTCFFDCHKTMIRLSCAFIQ